MPRVKDPLTEKNDGSDFQYRMSVDDKYKKAADSRKLLEKLNSSQAFFALSSALMSGAQLGRPSEAPAYPLQKPWWQEYASEATAHIKELSLFDSLPLYAIIFAAVSSMIGYVAVKGNRASPLRLQVLFAVTSSLMCLWPLVSGSVLSSCQEEYAGALESEDYTWFYVVLIKSLQDFLGLLVNIGVAFTASSLASTMTPQKKE